MTFKHNELRGVWTALITPFKTDGSVDEDALRILVRKQVQGGVTGIVPLGTTGECPTTDAETEDKRIFEICVEEAAGRILVMAGTGSNCTREAIHHTQLAKDAGADCCLVVCPYYNKPTEEGLRQHYLAIAELGLPLVIYNIKGRTGINMSTELIAELAKHPNIIGVKEASGDLAQMKEVIQKTPKNFVVLSGDDGLTNELIEMGGDGVVSVASNLIPRELSEMVASALNDDTQLARDENRKFGRLFKELFIETNPIPVKYAAHLMGLCEPIYRLPICPPTEESKVKIRELCEHYNLI
jgi:4-hydroxy-tetrahydrodipicolinate synthase